MNTQVGCYTLDDIQERALQQIRESMRNGHRRVLVVAPTGCVSGETVIGLNRGGKGYSRSIAKEFVNKFDKRRKPTVDTFVRSDVGEWIGLHRANDIVFSGVKQTFSLSLSNGFSLRATPDHEILTENGFIPLVELCGTDRVIHSAPTTKNRRIKKHYLQAQGLIHHPFAGNCRSLTARKNWTPQGRLYRVPYHRLVIEASLNNRTVDQFIYDCRNSPEICKGFQFLDPDIIAVHHINGDNLDNRLDNLLQMTHAEHFKLEGELSSYKNFGDGAMSSSIVESIKEFGEEPTFDVICDDPHRNFVANGIVVHNCGKTILSLAIAKLAAEKGSQVDFIVSGKTLVAQTAAKASKAGLDHSVWIAKHEEPFNHFAPFRIISKDTLTRRRESARWTPGKIIISDEVDISLSDIWQALQAEYPFSIGLTGTPCDGAGRGLGKHFDDMVNVANYSELIKTGRLVDIPESCCFSPHRPDLTGAKLGDQGDYQTTWLSNRMNTDKLVGDVVQHWERLGRNRPTLVCCVDKAHTAHVCDCFNGAGIPAEYVIDDTEDDERLHIFHRTAAGDNKVIVNCATLTRGFDLPCLSCLVLAAPTKRLRTYLQRVGRVLRSSPGKHDAILIDHSGSVWRHGWPTQDRDWSLDENLTTDDISEKAASDGKKQEPVERFCPNCACLMKFSIVCPNCGYKHPVRSQKAETIDGQLVNVKRTDVKKSSNKSDYQKLWMQCLAVMANRNGSYAMASGMFKGKTGLWPDDAQVGPLASTDRRQWKVATLWPGFSRKQKAHKP